MIGLTGATGEIVRRVAARLAATGERGWLLVRHASRAPSRDSLHGAEFEGYGDTVGMREPLAGVSTMLLVSGHEARDRVEQHKLAVREFLARSG